MISMKKVNASALYAVNHIPMKTWPRLVVKRFGDLDSDEREYAARILGTNDLPTKAFYAYLSVTVNRKEFTYLVTDEAPDKAVRRCFAESLTPAIDKRKLFSVLTDFCQQFNKALELNM